MGGIDWDKARRNRNVWKPDYREDFRREEEVADNTRQSAGSRVLRNPVSTKRLFTQPLTAREIRLRLKSRGVSGSKLTNIVNAILTGDEQLSWVEFDLDTQEMRDSGFKPCPPEEQDSTMVLRFQRLSIGGTVMEERRYTFTKNT
jgi:hypothetical protein